MDNNADEASHGLKKLPDDDLTGWIYQAPGVMERVEACFSGVAFEPHRHDTYAIGLTMAGVQTFDYRGTARHSLPGSAVVLHPDELHDGRAGSADGFRYRVFYVEPALIQNILGGRALPYVPDGISRDVRLCSAIERLVGDIMHPLEPFEHEDALFDLVVALNAVGGHGQGTLRSFDYAAAELARQYIVDGVDRPMSLDALEQIAGRDRWRLSRDFRALFGTSPYRYLVMRRLDRVRNLLLRGEALSDAAAACGFSDQSHMTRHFRKTYGMTPKQWLDSLVC